MTRDEVKAQVRGLARPYGLSHASWNFWKNRPTQHQCVVIVGEYVHGYPVIVAAQYDGVNFWGWSGGYHNQSTWAWLDAVEAFNMQQMLYDKPRDLPHLLTQFRPRGASGK